MLLPVLVAGPGLDVESAALFTANADEAAAAEAAAAATAAVEVAWPEVDPKPEVDPRVFTADEFPFPPVALEAELTRPASWLAILEF